MDMTPGDLPECPFCGCDAAEEVDAKGNAEWLCGTWHDAGEAPSQSDHCLDRVGLLRIITSLRDELARFYLRENREYKKGQKPCN